MKALLILFIASMAYGDGWFFGWGSTSGGDKKEEASKPVPVHSAPSHSTPSYSSPSYSSPSSYSHSNSRWSTPEPKKTEYCYNYDVATAKELPTEPTACSMDGTRMIIGRSVFSVPDEKELFKVPGDPKNQILLSGDGKLVFQWLNKDSFEVFSVDTGKPVTPPYAKEILESWRSKPAFFSNGKTQDGKYKIKEHYDKTTYIFKEGEYTPGDEVPEKYLKRDAYFLGNNYRRILFIDPEKDPTKKKLPVLYTFPRPFCFPEPKGIEDKAVDELAIKRLKEKLCREPYDQKEWEKTEPKVEADSKISQTAAVKELLRFQKQGGFEVKADLPRLIAILEKKTFAEKHPDLVTAALEGVLAKSSILYGEILGEYPWLTELETGEAKDACRTEKENEHFVDSANKYLKDLIVEQRAESKLEDWDSLKPLKTSLSQLTDKQKKNRINSIALSLKTGALSGVYRMDLFPANVVPIIAENLRPYFGLEKRTKTDIDVEQDGNKINYHIIGTDPIDATSMNDTDYGFSVTSSKEMGLPDAKGWIGKAQWTMDGKPYWAEIDGEEMVKNGPLVADTKSFPYQDFLKDGDFSGLVFVGDNIHDEFNEIMSQYVSFYKQRGYQFNPNPEEVANVPEKIRDLIQEGKIDYMLKEAHEGGPQSVLVEVKRTGKLYRGEVTRPDGKKESVYLLYTPSDKPETDVIATSHLRGWMGEREQKGHGGFVYFNTSCHAAKNRTMVNEIVSAGTQNFINIGADTQVDPLQVRPDNAPYQMMTNFLDQKDYAAIRKEMTRDPAYVLATIEDPSKRSAFQREIERNPAYKGYTEWEHFIFPDEKEYKELITDKVNSKSNRIYDIKVSVKEGLPPKPKPKAEKETKKEEPKS